MKKKDLIVLGVSLCLVATLGVGATLAYLTDDTQILTNTFTVGTGIDITLDETKYVDNEITDERTEEGNDYGDLQPGDSVKKDPTVTVVADSTDCYVFVEVNGIDGVEAKDFTVADIDSDKWIKVAGDEDTADGIYRYSSIVSKSDENQELVVFDGVTYNIDADGLATDIPEITIKACAVQSANIDVDTALVEAQKMFQ